jgi:hypothetical protein
VPRRAGAGSGGAACLTTRTHGRSYGDRGPQWRRATTCSSSDTGARRYYGLPLARRWTSIALFCNEFPVSGGPPGPVIRDARQVAIDGVVG